MNRPDVAPPEGCEWEFVYEGGEMKWAAVPKYESSAAKRGTETQRGGGGGGSETAGPSVVGKKKKKTAATQSKKAAKKSDEDDGSQSPTKKKRKRRKKKTNAPAAPPTLLNVDAMVAFEKRMLGQIPERFADAWWSWSSVPGDAREPLVIDE